MGLFLLVLGELFHPPRQITAVLRVQTLSASRSRTSRSADMAAVKPPPYVVGSGTSAGLTRIVCRVNRFIIIIRGIKIYML